MEAGGEPLALMAPRAEWKTTQRQRCVETAGAAAAKKKNKRTKPAEHCRSSVRWRSGFSLAQLWHLVLKSDAGIDVADIWIGGVA